MQENQKEIIFEFLRAQKQGVLSYSTDSQPSASVIDFSETQDLEIVFITLTEYRKYNILKKNPKVAMTFWGKENKTIQYEGVAEELNKIKFLPYLKYHVQKNPVEAKFSEMLKAKFFRIKPTWIKYADYGKDPWEVYEAKIIKA